MKTESSLALFEDFRVAVDNYNKMRRSVIKISTSGRR